MLERVSIGERSCGVMEQWVDGGKRTPTLHRSNTPLGPGASSVFLLLLASEINLDDTLVVLHFIHGAFAKHGALMQHGDLPRDLTDEDHVVFDDHDAVLAREAHEELARLGGLFVG